MSNPISKTVRLQSVSRDDAQIAMDRIEEIFDAYDVPDEARLVIWEQFQVFASDVLIRFGEFNPPVGYSEQNGHS